MAVQKSKKSRSKRDKKRNANTKFIKSTLSIDKETGESHIRHHITKSGYYKGIKVIINKPKKQKKTSD